jgi:uncharacterized protein (TIGR00730 family)
MTKDQKLKAAWKVTVFGGSQPTPGTYPYEQACQLGKRLAELGCQVITGGYIGTMEAVSKGANEVGGYVIGITCDEIERWRPVGPNPFLNQEIRVPTLRQRLYTLIDMCDIALALPGGIGTLAEISAMWTQLDINAISPKPLILIGDEWRNVIRCFHLYMEAYISSRQLDWIQYAPTVENAIEHITHLFSSSSK